MQATVDTTRRNLDAAFTCEARASRRYVAFAHQAMKEGHPDIAQLFLQAAGDETTHAFDHLTILGAVGATRQNLDEAAHGDCDEAEDAYRRFIDQALDDERLDAVASFAHAMEREKCHREQFRHALDTFGFPRAEAGVVVVPGD